MFHVNLQGLVLKKDHFQNFLWPPSPCFHTSLFIYPSKQNRFKKKTQPPSHLNNNSGNKQPTTFRLLYLQIQQLQGSKFRFCICTRIASMRFNTSKCLSSISGGQMFFGKMHDGLPCSPTVDGRNPAPADMVFFKNANDGMNFLSTGALS